MTNPSKTTNTGGQLLILIVFWAYVTIPLAWGVYQTFKKALALFH